MSQFVQGVEFEIDGIFMQIAAVIFFGIAANFCYTGGWIVEVALYLYGGKGDTRFAPVAFVAGSAFSVLLTLCPALFLIGYAILMVFKPTP